MEKTIIIRTHEDASRFAERILNAKIVKPLKVEVSLAKKRRSLAQNNLNWLWCDTVRTWLWEAGIGFKNVRGESIRPYTAEEIHEWHKALFLPTVVVEINGRKNEQRNSRRLTVQAFTDFLEQIDVYWVEQGLQLPHPDNYMEAMGHEMQ